MLTPDVEALVLAIGVFEESGTMPVDGGLLDQSSSFVLGLHTYRGERAAARREKDEIQRRIDKAMGVRR